jgi:hypothetical protein
MCGFVIVARNCMSFLNDREDIRLVSQYFQAIFSVFAVVATIAIISLVYDNDLIQYLAILTMIGLCTAYAIIAVFDCSNKAHIILVRLFKHGLQQKK